MASINIQFNIKNMGPHTDLHQDLYNLNSAQLRIFANNGMGKTTISKIFRLESLFHKLDNGIDEKDIINQKIVLSKDLLTFNQKNGEFEFSIGGNSLNSFNVKLKKDKVPVIDNKTDYIFHVFNTDFVLENLLETKYSFNENNFKGYIMGKESIDSSRLNKKMEDIKKDKEFYKKCIIDKMEENKTVLRDLDIRASTKEYKDISFENLINEKEIESENWEKLLESYEKIKIMPDDIDDIILKKFNSNFNFFNKITEILSTSYEKSFFGENFDEKIKDNHEFIEKGMDLYEKYNKNSCPFCKQKISKNSEVINLYDAYLNNSESTIIKNIENLISKLNKFKEDYDSFMIDFSKMENEFNNIKDFIPSLSNTCLEKIPNDNSEFDENFSMLINFLENKKRNISLVCNLFKENINFFIGLKNNLDNFYDINKTKIEKLNKTKNNINNEKLILRKDLCKSMYNLLLTNQKENICHYNEKNNELINIQKKINDLSNKKSKRKEVAKSFNHYLNFFFLKKYQFDEDKFLIIFGDETLEHNVGAILSEGERKILAFCYYLSLVHTLVKEEKDYQKLFFILDDPISSLDFDYVYALSKAIKDIKNHFSLDTLRYIIFTHDFEFMNILIRDNERSSKQNYYLKINELKSLDEKLLLPYDNHIKDVVDFYKGESSHCHTIPNSLRHIIETIMNFEKPNYNLGNYITENKLLNENGHLYKLMNDLSHGKYRNQAVSPEILKQCCESVLKFIHKKYPNQLKSHDLDF